MKIIQSPIALFGTSADPPTCAHQALLEGLLELFPNVVTWASDNPMKKHKASLEKRHELLSALVQTISNPQLMLIQELSSPWTIKTLELASLRWPKAEFVFVIGSDLTCQIPKWLHANAILQKVRLGIAPREGWPIKRAEIKTIESLGGRIELLPLKIPAISSSKIRTNPQPEQIPKALLPILLKDNIYGLTKGSN